MDSPRIIVFLGWTYLMIIGAFAQKSTTLEPNSSFHKELQPGLIHQYSIKLAKSQFLLLRVIQEGIDLKINAYSPDNNSLGEYDNHNGQFGPEIVTVISEVAGEYRFEVSPSNEEQPKGKYTLMVDRVVEAAKTMEGKVDQLFAAWDNDQSPGASIAVVKDGKIIYSKGYGLANLEYGIPNQPNTVFHIASVSKQFTAFAIAMLADQGKLSLDDDIRKYLPEVPDLGRLITIRHLVHHTSGLRDQWALLAMAGWRLDDVITKDHIMKLISRQELLNFEPGNEFLYCNTGYTLLAEIVSRISGKPFHLWTQENIFEPLGMEHTLFYHDHQKIVKNRAYSYGESPDGFNKRVLNYANVGATSLFTTVEDLALWAVNFENIKVGNQAIMDQMHQQGILNNGDTISYAFGQGIGKYKGLNIVSHSGGDAGYRTYLVRFPDQKFSVIVFSNLASFNPSPKAFEIADIYLTNQLKNEPEEVEPVDKGKTEISISKEILQSYIGKYEISQGLLFDIKLEAGQLTAQATGRPQVSLEPKSENEFLLVGTSALIVFKKNDKGEVDKLILKQGDQETPANKLPPFNPKEVNLRELAGTYYSSELATSYLLVLKNDSLIAEHSRHPSILLTPVDIDTFRGDTWFFRKVEFIRNASREIIGCSVSNGRVRNLKFWKM